MGTYGDKIKAEYIRSGISPAQIRANKVARWRARSEERRQMRREAAEKRNAAYQALPLSEKIKRNSKKVREKLTPGAK